MLTYSSPCTLHKIIHAISIGTEALRGKHTYYDVHQYNGVILIAKVSGMGPGLRKVGGRSRYKLSSNTSLNNISF